MSTAEKPPKKPRAPRKPRAPVIVTGTVVLEPTRAELVALALVEEAHRRDMALPGKNCLGPLSRAWAERQATFAAKAVDPIFTPGQVAHGILGHYSDKRLARLLKAHNAVPVVPRSPEPESTEEPTR